jgi:hypothetical protein
LLDLFAGFKLDSPPQTKKKLGIVIEMINKAKPFKAVYGDADMTVSKKLNNKIAVLFDDITGQAKKSGVDCNGQ